MEFPSDCDQIETSGIIEAILNEEYDPNDKTGDVKGLIPFQI